MWCSRPHFRHLEDAQVLGPFGRVASFLVGDFRGFVVAGVPVDPQLRIPPMYSDIPVGLLVVEPASGGIDRPRPQLLHEAPDARCGTLAYDVPDPIDETVNSI